VHALVVGAQLQVVESLVQDRAGQRPAVGRSHGRPLERALPAFDGAEIARERLLLRRRHRLRRHPLRWPAVADDRGELRLRQERHAEDDRRSGVAAVAVGTVAHGAARLEGGAARPGLRLGAGRRGDDEKRCDDEAGSGPEHDGHY
jgi:hypothetical protein